MLAQANVNTSLKIHLYWFSHYFAKTHRQIKNQKTVIFRLEACFQYAALTYFKILELQTSFICNLNIICMGFVNLIELFVFYLPRKEKTVYLSCVEFFTHTSCFVLHYLLNTECVKIGTELYAD